MASDTEPGYNLTLPLSNDGKTVRTLFMSLPGQLTAVEWDRLMALLDVMKPGLVVTEQTMDAEMGASS